jgi:hypothetical protein
MYYKIDLIKFLEDIKSQTLFFPPELLLRDVAVIGGRGWGYESAELAASTSEV